jgi:hypothetical protein
MNTAPFQFRYAFTFAAIWLPVAWMNMHYPGDEYAGFLWSALPGIWISCFLSSGDINFMLPRILATGAVVMALWGFVMDWLRFPYRQWLAIFLILAVAVSSWALLANMNVRVGKHGSWPAYVLPSVNLALYLSSVVAIAGRFIFGTAGYPGFMNLLPPWRGRSISGQRDSGQDAGTR